MASAASLKLETSLSGSWRRKTWIPFSAAEATNRRTKSGPTGREPTRKRPRSASPSGVVVRASRARIRSQGLSTPRRTALSNTPPPETSSEAKPARSRSSARSRIADVGSRPASGSCLTSRTVVSTSCGIPARTLTRRSLSGWKLSEGVEHEIEHGQERGEGHSHSQRAWVSQRVGEPSPDVREQRARVRHQRPAVPPKRAAEVDPEGGREQAAADKGPAPPPTRNPPHHGLHQVQREKAHQRPGPREGTEEHEVEPQRRVAARAQV